MCTRMCVRGCAFIVGIGILCVGVCIAVAVSCIDKHPVGWQSVEVHGMRNTCTSICLM